MRQLLFLVTAIVAVAILWVKMPSSFALSPAWEAGAFRLNAGFRTPAVGRHRKPRWWHL